MAEEVLEDVEGILVRVLASFMSLQSILYDS